MLEIGLGMAHDVAARIGLQAGEPAEWGARLGALVPSANVVFERDARLLLPIDVSLHVARMRIQEDSEGELAGLAAQAPATAQQLADAAVDALAFACTSGSFLGGPGYDDRLRNELELTIGVPTTTTSSGIVQILRDLQCRTLSLVSPYEPWLNERAGEFFASSGFRVESVRGMGLTDPLETAAIAPQEIVTLVEQADVEEAEAVVISCTAFRGVEAALILGDRLGKPIVAANYATLATLVALVNRSLVGSLHAPFLSGD